MRAIPLRTSICCLVLFIANISRAQDWNTEAYGGSPFGVARISLTLTGAGTLAPDRAMLLSEKSGRTHYPVFETTGLRSPVTKTAGGPRTITAYFLFRGDKPLELTLRGENRYQKTMPIKSDSHAHAILLQAWWAGYAANAQAAMTADVYPTLAENYLTSMLARRTSLFRPQYEKPWAPWTMLDDDILALLTGAESVRIAAQSKSLLDSPNDDEKANQPIPTAVVPPPVNIPKIAEGSVPLEPIAQVVPAECFYIRCGSYDNFRWLRDSIDEWGTFARHISSVRAYDYKLSERLERQLALRDTALGRLLGDQVISDVAIIGFDPFVREGAAIGIVFEAKSNTIIGEQIKKFRQEALATIEGATEKSEKFGDQTALFLSTPENTIRSFYATSGKYHLVTTSRKITARFFEAAAGKDSLAQLNEFRWGRSKAPLADNHSAFVYLSDPFFRNLVGPHYRVEMTRRIRALSEIDVVRMARWAAIAEGQADTKSDKPGVAENGERLIASLTATGFLPNRFGRRPDTSRVTVRGEVLGDSLRGSAGVFTPVADMAIDKVTSGEAEAYQNFARMYSAEWQRMDPVIIGIKRQPLPKERKERIVFDVHITPFARSQYDIFTRYSFIDDKQFAMIPGDIAQLQVNLGRAALESEDKYILALRNGFPQFAIADGEVKYAMYGEEWVPAYLAGQNRDKKGRPALLNFISPSGPADKDGDIPFNSFLFEGPSFHRKLADFDLIGPKMILNDVAPNLKIVDAPREAQLRLRINDLANTGWATMIDAESFVRARRVSAGNAMFMEMLSQQFNIPLADARVAAERLLGATLVCPLGGKYETSSGFDDAESWHSTAWTKPSLYEESRLPKGFKSPLLTWFAGLSLDFHVKDPVLTTHIELDVRKK